MWNRIKLFLQNFQGLYFPDLTLSGILEILIIFFIVYKIVAAIKDTRAWSIFKGIIVVLVFYLLSNMLNFYVISAIIKSLSGTVLIAVILIFHNDIQKVFEKIGKKEFLPELKLRNMMSKNKEERYTDKKEIDEIIESIKDMSRDKTGVLMVFEKDVVLDEYKKTGIPLSSKITKEMVANIFENEGRLHDGAVIIKNNTIEAATCYLPLSKNPSIHKSLGTRHRAAIGATEYTDAIVVVVSEETGTISYVENGEIQRPLTPDELRDLLYDNLSKGIKKRDIKKDIRLFFSKDLQNKGIALALSLLVWFSYMNIISPPIKKTVENIPIEVKNEEVFNNIGKTYDISKNEYINVVIEGNAADVGKIRREDIKASIDLKKLSITNAAEVKLSIPDNSNVKISTVDERMINVDVDDLSVLEWNLEVETKNIPPKGFVFNKVDFNEGEKVIISGPKKLLSKIEKVFIEVDLKNAKNKEVIASDIIIKDRNGEVMNSNNIKLNKSKAVGSIIMFKSKEVDVNVNFIKSEQSEFLIKDISYEPSKVLISGDQEDLDKINSIDIDLGIDDLSKGESAQTYTKIINLNEFLKEGLFVGEEDSKIKVDIILDSLVEKEFKVKAEDIKIDNAEYMPFNPGEDIQIKLKIPKSLIENYKVDGKDFMIVKLTDTTGTLVYQGDSKIKLVPRKVNIKKMSN